MPHSGEQAKESELEDLQRRLNIASTGIRFHASAHVREDIERRIVELRYVA